MRNFKLSSFRFIYIHLHSFTFIYIHLHSKWAPTKPIGSYLKITGANWTSWEPPNIELAQNEPIGFVTRHTYSQSFAIFTTLWMNYFLYEFTIEWAYNFINFSYLRSHAAPL